MGRARADLEPGRWRSDGGRADSRSPATSCAITATCSRSRRPKRRWSRPNVFWWGPLHYEKSGPVVLERIRRVEDWNVVKNDFFTQHARRQVPGGRPIAFADERKRELHGSLLRRHPAQVHMTVLRVGARALAYHYGFIWNGVLYWGAPCFDREDDKHSPGLLLLAFALRQAHADGLRGVDRTMGTEPYTARFGSECVPLPSMSVDYDRPTR